MTTIVNAGAGYQSDNWRLAVDIFNLLNAKANDITYFYDFRSTPAGPAESGFLFHPVLPGSARVTLTCYY